MSLAYQVYSQVATQLQIARARFRRRNLCLLMVEPAVVPLLPSGHGYKNVCIDIYVSDCFYYDGMVADRKRVSA